MSLLRQEAVHSGGTSGTLSGHLCIDAISRHSLSSIGELCRPASDESVTLANQPRVRFSLVADWRTGGQSIKKAPAFRLTLSFANTHFFVIKSISSYFVRQLGQRNINKRSNMRIYAIEQLSIAIRVTCESNELSGSKIRCGPGKQFTYHSLLSGHGQ